VKMSDLMDLNINLAGVQGYSINNARVRLQGLNQCLILLGGKSVKLGYLTAHLLLNDLLLDLS